FESFIEAIELGSLRGQQEQARYLEQQQGLDEDEKQPLLEPPPRKRVLDILSKLRQVSLICGVLYVVS
ncbi:hypothetical protein, partial [Nostoc sp. 'Peltigera malacea cyanobiont' DB3992]|uniref:hypothetical protein n=1 Tax=Nostoc sp. 'Peltigera malacea cyanobiont' DB3992 TaxID=1206980 RepID=UPI000C06625C